MVQTAFPRERLALLARRIHRLGPRPLLELFRELETGKPLHPTLETYARLEPLVGFIEAEGGAEIPPARLAIGMRGRRP